MLHITRVHRIRLLLVVSVLLAAVWFGLKEGTDGFLGAETPPQRAAAVLQLLYGSCAVASLVALLTRRRWLRAALVSWAATLIITGTLSPVVWAGSPWFGGLLSGAITAVVAALVVWGALASNSDASGMMQHASRGD